MTNTSPDTELVSAYVAQGSEHAFRALVARHVDLVYGTAMRQVGDSGMAEEIAQNVFVALARKAPRLAGVSTLAGWLYRTTVMECKVRVRSELRRRRRETVAAERILIESEGEAILDQVLPLLDESLMVLRDEDRLALVLRFFENRSLREVGVVLGVQEDAARKRVDRALERVSRFFRERGFAAGVGGGAAAWLAGAAQAAPAGLSVTCAQAALSTVGAFSGASLTLFKFMALTKTQAAVICLAIAAVPLIWQTRTLAGLARSHDEVSRRVTLADRRAAELDDSLAIVRMDLQNLQRETQRIEMQGQILNAQLAGQTPAPAYRWDDNSSVVRVPKALLQAIDMRATANRSGALTEEIREVLQMTESEAGTVQAAMGRFVAEYERIQAERMRKIEPTEEDKRWRPSEEVRVFEIPDVTEQFRELRGSLFAEVAGTLGAERSEFFRQKLQYWMPIDDQDHGLSSGQAIIPFAHRVRFYPAQPGVTWLGWGFSKLNGEGVSGSIEIEDIPQAFRTELQDWIAIAQSKPPVAGRSQP